MGIENGKQYNGTTLETQVCIIGSGPAGITAAWHLVKNGVKDVILIEGSRTLDLDASRADKIYLYNGKADGLFDPNEPEFLILPTRPDDLYQERERVFGGTSAHWAGQCRPLDPITFEKREGFPGWPIKRTDLDPYYAEAVEFLNLYGNYYDSAGNAGYNFTTQYWERVLGAKAPQLDKFDAEMYQWPGGIYNFAQRKFRDGYHRKTIGETDVKVILNASLLDIDHTGGVVNRLHVASLDDQQPKPAVATEFFIRADAYVLACGAVANARQLLLSNVGNKDQVGHYFMCHPIPTWTFPVVASPAFFSEDESNFMDGASWRDPDTGVKVAGRISPKAKQQCDLKIGGCWFNGTNAIADPQTYASGIYYEMHPNEESCVTLDGSPDEVFKQQQTKITWKLSKEDEETYNRSTQLYKEVIEDKVGRGKVSLASWKAVVPEFRVNGHHIGTTRMSDKSMNGVVDKNLKVHSLDNLYVAGSSVFPTAGISNPTFTIVALSIRLAEHLGKKLSD